MASASFGVTTYVCRAQRGISMSENQRGQGPFTSQTMWRLPNAIVTTPSTNPRKVASCELPEPNLFRRQGGGERS